MALPLSLKRQQDKKKKFEKKLVNFLKDFRADDLKKSLDNAFIGGKSPNASEFVKLVSSAKFGGENYWVSGAQGQQVILKVFNYIWPKVFDNLSLFDEQIQENEPIGFSHITETFIGYLYNYIHVFPKMGQFLRSIDPADFKSAIDISPYLYLEKETNAYGFLLLPLQMTTTNDIEQNLGNLWNETIPWKLNPFPSWSPNSSYSTGSLEYISPFILYFGTTEELVDLIPDREELDVIGHYRNLRSGKIIPVKGHTKRKPIRARITSDQITNHIVYRVFDDNKQLRYIGEGKPNRYEHVNSGISHNIKINEHYFLKGKMEVEIIMDNLSKSESLAIEKILLNQHKGEGLWNIKDYEPNEDYSLKGYSDEEVLEYVSNKDV